MTTFNSNYDETNPFSDTCAQVALGAAVAETYTVPGANNQRYRAYFTYQSNSAVFVGLNATAVVPGAGSVDTTANIEFKPKKRYVHGGDVISMITPDTTAYMGIAILTLPSTL